MRGGGDGGGTPTPVFINFSRNRRTGCGGGMRYAAPPPRLLIIHSAGERDPGRTRYATPAHPLFINYSLGRRTGHGENEVCNPHPPFINYSFSRRTGPGENEVRTPPPPHPPPHLFTPGEGRGHRHFSVC